MGCLGCDRNRRHKACGYGSIKNVAAPFTGANLRANLVVENTMYNQNSYHTIKYSINEPIARVTLNRPEIHNAFNEKMIRELLDLFTNFAEDESVRVIVLTGEGKSFCAGADLMWMKQIIDYSYEQNLEESLRLSDLLYLMYTLPKPTIARVNGAAIGGGAGLMSVCDLVIASEHAKIGLSEVKMGLVPACISPYVVRRVGENVCRELFLTGERVDAQRALSLRLVNKIVPPEELDAAVEDLTKKLLTSAPNALALCKELLHKVPLLQLEKAKRYTAEIIASLRVSGEGQEGMAAFLEKRRPKWVVES